MSKALLGMELGLADRRHYFHFIRLSRKSSTRGAQLGSDARITVGLCAANRYQISAGPAFVSRAFNQ